MQSWASTQTIIALSRGEAELYAINKCAAVALGLQSLMVDLGVSMDVKLFTDANTGKAMATRKGPGHVKHISKNELWIKAKMSEKVKPPTITKVVKESTLLRKWRFRISGHSMCISVWLPSSRGAFGHTCFRRSRVETLLLGSS